MGKLIEITSCDLRCDNPACGFVAKGIQPSEVYIGVPCPRCRCNLLTRADYEQWQKFCRAAEFLNRWFGWLTWFSRGKVTRASVNPHNGGFNVRHYQD